MSRTDAKSCSLRAKPTANGVIRLTQRGGADVGRRCPKMPAKGAVEIGQVIEARFGGDVGDLAMTRSWITQQHSRLFQTLLPHMMRKAFAGLFEE